LTYSRQRNEEYPWHEFDPESYLANNYVAVRDDDQQTLKFVRDFFVRVFSSDPIRAGRRGIDVGTGSNLYPALAMLPFCDRVTLYEYSQSNIDWLTKQCIEGWPSWSQVWVNFWQLLSEHNTYAKFATFPHVELARCVDLIMGSVFDLGASIQRWDVGTMFFVAESITTQRSEFVDAVDNFLNALRPGAPFAIAFMENSSGYQVAGKSFPAIAVGRDDVRRFLNRRASNLVFEHFGPGGNPLRDGYTGMIVACGRTKA
jgi:NNMT/PNMT/TEMT family